MTSRAIKRGFDPNDLACFTGAPLEMLRLAHEELRYLSDRGYKSGPAAVLIGNHYQLTARQRYALIRSTASADQCQRRAATRLKRPPSTEPVLIDGFNLIITLETALSKSLLLLGDDDVLRDLASLRGSYRIISQTEPAIDLICDVLQELGVTQAFFYLDSPVSNSGKLRQLILSRAAGWDVTVSCDLATNPDAVLSGQQAVVSGDALILDRCQSWFNLTRLIVSQKIPDSWIVDLSSEK
jgi:hypothetical protein